MRSCVSRPCYGIRARIAKSLCDAYANIVAYAHADFRVARETRHFDIRARKHLLRVELLQHLNAPKRLIR
eukprot:3601604-Pleurochrysis_carterae.AAC.1